MIELDVDMGYLGDEDLRCVILHDENGEHESIEYVRKVEYDEMREATARRKDRCSELLDENAKLREENLRLKTLVEDMHRAFFSLDVDYCQACPRDNRLYPCPRYTIGGGECKFETEMRELGIEVDE